MSGKLKWSSSKHSPISYCWKDINGQSIELVKPTTFMNKSGLAIGHLVKKHQLKPQDLIVVHDDKDLPLGKLRIQINHGAAGHNGVKSIIEHLKSTNFIRVRIGIQSDETENTPAEKLVLQKFSKKEKLILKKVINQANEAIKMIIEKGLNKAMSKFN
ncbi:MAG: aminoacyl-tRNA hydrolase [Patescibacteria group bacterium]|nr:aminoacyl-tRNA hydrolase [Patescibacteria group bacterium]